MVVVKERAHTVSYFQFPNFRFAAIYTRRKEKCFLIKLNWHFCEIELNKIESTLEHSTNAQCHRLVKSTVKYHQQWQWHESYSISFLCFVGWHFHCQKSRHNPSREEKKAEEGKISAIVWNPEINKTKLQNHNAHTHPHLRGIGTSTGTHHFTSTLNLCTIQNSFSLFRLSRKNAFYTIYTQHKNFSELFRYFFLFAGMVRWDFFAVLGDITLTQTQYTHIEQAAPAARVLSSRSYRSKLNKNNNIEYKHSKAKYVLYFIRIYVYLLGTCSSCVSACV